MRLFVAVRLTSELQQAVGAFIAQNVVKTKGVKWVDASQAHFTLFFLGEQPARLVTELDPLLQKAAAGQGSFLLTLGPGGVFPSWKAPRVLWLGVEKGQEELKALAARVTAVCVERGVAPPDCPFTPHLTLGRVKSPPVAIDRETLTRGVAGEMTVTAFTLFASELRPEGPLYRELGTYQLGK
ncbi:MAG: RNA 2',3'-cyclic phosphodiesterase [Firmicutes bacterium]|nr:RNA 2',3'-cyclic phosphodiesterase [Bacillota bacterium]